ncbi:MAG TPA: sugar transferase [Polyangiaceae bacterium]|nr:sugar transferase [Polyangiaceae bacterium]
MRVTKRILDISVAVVGLLLTAWIFPIIALLTKLDSPGPVFFRQKRAGALKHRDGQGRCTFQTFSMYKFRTMRPDAEKYTGAVLASENDPRITRVGRTLRKTRLDELPQLWNVLRGDMSLIGPRPERPELFEHLVMAIPFFEERMRGVKPGITGFAQISLGYSGRPLPGSPIATHLDSLINPYKLEQTDGAEADDMRVKLLFDLAYVTALERFGTFIKMELLVLFKTPLVMLRGLGR